MGECNLGHHHDALTRIGTLKCENCSASGSQLWMTLQQILLQQQWQQRVRRCQRSKVMLHLNVLRAVVATTNDDQVLETTVNEQLAVLHEA